MGVLRNFFTKVPIENTTKEIFRTNSETLAVIEKEKKSESSVFPDIRCHEKADIIL